MSTAAVMLVRDEADVIEKVVRHLLWHVDEVIVADNRSTDGTREILARLPVVLQDDPEVGYWQSAKTTALAMQALDRGHSWVVPCDADEVWHPGDPDVRIADYLAALNPDVIRVRAPIFNHFPSAKDPKIANLIKSIGYRKRLANGAKMAGRLHAEMVIEMGNHDITTPWTSRPVDGLNVRHFSWRTERQWLLKLKNGIEAYRAADGMPEQYGVGWRQWEGKPEEAALAWFRRWAFSSAPESDDSLMYDPAPLKP